MELVAVRAQALKLGTVAAFEHQLASAGLSAEVASDHTLHLAPLPASACCPPLPEALLGDQLGVTPTLYPLPAGGWQVLAVHASPPPHLTPQALPSQ